MAATTKGATGAAGGAGADAVLLEAAATALPAAVAGVLVRGVKKVAAACFFCTAAAVLATSDFFAFFAFDLAPSFAPRVRPIAQSKRRAKDLAKDSTRVEQEPLFSGNFGFDFSTSAALQLQPQRLDLVSLGG